jgi:hypothetical protein
VLRVETLPEDKLHLFSTEVAETHGIAAAVVYQYFTWHCRKFGQWTGTMDQLLKVFPYLSRKELRLVLHKLLGERAGYATLLHRHAVASQFSYTLTVRVRGQKLHALDPKMAQAHGLLAAVVYDNVVFWIARSEAEGESEPVHYASPRAWRENHPYAALRSVARAFQSLQQAGELVIAARRENRMPVWTLPLGLGKLDRWHRLHRQVKRESVSADPKVKYVYVPVLDDPD